MKKLFSGLFFTQLLNFLVKPIYLLVIDLGVQNAAEVSKADYGSYFSMLTLSLLFVAILDPGLHNYAVQKMSRNKDEAGALFRTAARLKGVLSLLYLAAIGIAGLIMNLESFEWVVLGGATTFQLISSGIMFNRSYFTASQVFKLDGIFSVSERLLSILIIGAMLIHMIPGFDLTVIRFAWAQAFAALCVLMISSVVLIRHLKSKTSEISFSLKQLLRESGPFALLTALMGLYNYMDGVMINQFATSPNTAAGDYAMGWRIYLALLVFAQFFANYLLPVFSEHSEKNMSYSHLAKSAFRLLISGIALTIVPMLIFSDDLIQLLYPEKWSDDAVLAFMLLIPGLAANAFTFVFGTALTAERLLKKLNVFALFTLILNVVLNVWLIPLWGASGAAFSTLLSQSFFGLACYFSAGSNRLTEFDWVGVAMPLLASAVLVILGRWWMALHQDPMIPLLVFGLLGIGGFWWMNKAMIGSVLKSNK